MTSPAATFLMPMLSTSWTSSSLIDLAAQLEQLADETAGGIDAGLPSQQTADHRMAGPASGDDIAGNEHQLGLAGSARGEFEAVVAQLAVSTGNSPARRIPILMSLPPSVVRQAHHAGFDDIQTQPRFPGRENRIRQDRRSDFSSRARCSRSSRPMGANNSDASQGFEQNFGTHRQSPWPRGMDD